MGGAKQAFLNQAFSSDPAVAFPRFGAGFTVAKEFDNGLDVRFGSTTVQGTRTGEQVDFELDSSDLFQALQFGYDFGAGGVRDSRLQVLFWHSDAVRSAGQAEGQGVSMTFERTLDDDAVRGYARLAWSDGGATPVDLLLSAGLAWRCGDHDLLGIAAGCGRGSGPGHPVQAVVEGFYRWQPREGLRLSPDVQILAGDGFAGGGGVRILVGFRTEFAF